MPCLECVFRVLQGVHLDNGVGLPFVSQGIRELNCFLLPVLLEDLRR